MLDRLSLVPKSGFLVVAMLVSALAPASAQAPDKIFFGGTVVTMVDGNLFAEAVAVREDRIVEVGSLKDIEAISGASTERIDLEGGTLLPGFIDPHGHFLGAGTRMLLAADLRPPPMGTMTNMDELVAALKERADAHPDASYIQGSGYDDTLLEEMRHPNRHDLDRVSTIRPVVITHISGHVAAGNSTALEAAGITASTPDPDGGRIVKDPETGEPTGVMEGNARSLLGDLVPPPSREQALAGLRQASQMWAAHRFTTATDNVRDAGLIEDVYKAGLEEGDLFVRLVYWPRTTTIEEAREFPAVRSGTDLTGGRHMITQGPHKLQIDGSPQGYTAHFTQPYTTQRPQDDGEYRGFAYWDDLEAFKSFVGLLHGQGWQITIHGNGDQGIQDALDALGTAQQTYPREDARHTIQHAQFTRPDQLDQMAALGVAPSFFIGHTFYWGDRHKNVFFGEHRAEHMSPLRGALDRGIRASTHTDTPVVPIDGIQMIWSSVNRISSGGDVIGANQRVTPLEALKAITINAAWQYFQEDLKGTIEPGKLADFVVLSENPLSVGHLDPMEIKDINVLRTIVGGETVFEGVTESIIARHFPD